MKPTEQVHAYPPGPSRSIPFMSLLAYRRSPLPFFQQFAREYGDITYFRLVEQEAFFINHPDLIRDVLVTNHQNFMKGLALQRAKRLLGEGLLTSEGDFHVRQRRLAQPAFHRDRIASYGTVMTDYALQTSERWRDGQIVDVFEEMMRLTLAIVGKTLFDADVESDAAEVGEAMTVVMDLFNTISIPYYNVLEKLPLPNRRRFETAKAKLDNIIFRMIDERRRSNVDRGDLLSMLLMARDFEDTDTSTGSRMTNSQVRDEAMTLFLAGHETTANALTWTWYLLSQNPAVEEKLHKEIEDIVGHEAPTIDSVPKLKYTEMVLSEAMRLYPPAWALGRMALTDSYLGGYFIPKRALVLMSQYVTHRDERYFPDPERFDPERWTPEARESRPQFSYFPFGGGPRRCIGEGFTWMEGALLLATLAKSWKLRLVPGHPVELKPRITLRPKYGMKMIVHRRS